MTTLEQIQAAQDGVNAACNTAKATIQANQDAMNSAFEGMKTNMIAVAKDFPASLVTPTAPVAQ